MAYIQLETFIKAPAQLCFDLSRSIDLHQESMQQSAERAIAGVTSGLIKEGETVTWEARHFGIRMHMTIGITAMQFSYYFRDEMLSGPFKRLWHEHLFWEEKDGTMMVDDFEFASPLGLLGKLADRLVLKKYMTHLLMKRNSLIKRVAEEQAKGG